MRKLFKAFILIIFIAFFNISWGYTDEWVAADRYVEQESRKQGDEYAARIGGDLIVDLAKASYNQRTTVDYYEKLLKQAVQKHEPWLYKASINLLEEAYKQKLTPSERKEWYQKSIVPLTRLTMDQMRHHRLEFIRLSFEYQRNNMR